MVKTLQVSGKNTFCSINVDKTRGKRFFQIVHWPFKLPPNQHRLAGPSGWISWCKSARPSKGQCRSTKIFLPLVLVIKVFQNIYLPETYNASTFLSSDSQCVGFIWVEIAQNWNWLCQLFRKKASLVYWVRDLSAVKEHQVRILATA